MTIDDRLRMTLGGLILDNIALQARVEELEAKAKAPPAPERAADDAA